MLRFHRYLVAMSESNSPTEPRTSFRSRAIKVIALIIALVGTLLTIFTQIGPAVAQFQSPLVNMQIQIYETIRINEMYDKQIIRRREKKLTQIQKQMVNTIRSLDRRSITF